MKKLSILILLGWLISFSCTEEGKPLRTPNGNYLPLKVGNSWRLRTDVTTSSIDGLLEMEVTGTTTVQHKEYFVMTSIWTFSGQVTDNITELYRMDSQGDVFILKDGEEKLKFRLAPKEGEHWGFESSSYPTGEMKYAGLETVTLNTTAIDNCMVFVFDDEPVVDEEVWTVVASEIGFVNIGSMWMQFNLTKAVIDGTVHEF